MLIGARDRTSCWLNVSLKFNLRVRVAYEITLGYQVFGGLMHPKSGEFDVLRVLGFRVFVNTCEPTRARALVRTTLASGAPTKDTT